MKRFAHALLIGSAAAAGCHYADRTETRWSVHENTSELGLFSSKKTSKTTPVRSKFHVCLAEHAGNPDATGICQCLDIGLPLSWGYWQNGVYHFYCSTSVGAKAK